MGINYSEEYFDLIKGAGFDFVRLPVAGPLEQPHRAGMALYN